MLTESPDGVQARELAAGAVAGVVAVLVFTTLHQIFINSIWWMFPIMAIAGAACGLCLAWCYATLVPNPSWRTWWGFIALFNIMFGLLALASAIIYEPIITMAEMVESSGGNPIPMSETLPLMIAFTLGWAGLLALVYKAGWRGFGAASATISVLMLLLGFNLSTVGLVDVPTEGWVLLAEFFGYVTALSVTYGLTHTGLMRFRGSG
ncbi:MAG TPA: hypothetical protein VMS74_14365 [Acidimicrobiia bacterium]|nr:hypothetical protein [Acidimicrobiia bacterium]